MWHRQDDLSLFSVFALTWLGRVQNLGHSLDLGTEALLSYIPAFAKCLPLVPFLKRQLLAASIFTILGRISHVSKLGIPPSPSDSGGGRLGEGVAWRKINNGNGLRQRQTSAQARVIKLYRSRKEERFMKNLDWRFRAIL